LYGNAKWPGLLIFFASVEDENNRESFRDIQEIEEIDRVSWRPHDMKLDFEFYSNALSQFLMVSKDQNEFSQKLFFCKNLLKSIPGVSLGTNDSNNERVLERL
jgi:hypothetical protein